MTMQHIRRWEQAERGQSLVEMALGLVILTFVVMGILDLGRIYFVNVALEDAAGEAALYLSMYPDCPTSTQCADKNNAQYRAKNSGGDGVDWSAADFTYSYENFSAGACDQNQVSRDLDCWTTTKPSTFGSGSMVRVTLRATYRILTPVIGAIVRGNSIYLYATAIGVAN